MTKYLLTHCTTIERIVLFLAALGFIIPNFWGAVFGSIVLVTVVILQKTRIAVGPDGKTMDGIKIVMANGR